MCALLMDADYFSMRAMKNRAPALYHEYIGRFRLAEPGEGEEISEDDVEMGCSVEDVEICVGDDEDGEGALRKERPVAPSSITIFATQPCRHIFGCLLIKRH